MDLRFRFVGGLPPHRDIYISLGESKSLLRYVNLSKATIYSQIFDIEGTYVLEAVAIGKIALVDRSNQRVCNTHRSFH